MSTTSPRDKNASRDVEQAAIIAPKADITPPANTKKVFIKTYGCQMNVYDSERMADVLAPIGYAPVDAPDHADLVILNTCHIREKAAEKVYSELGRIRQHKEKNKPDMKVAVAGCVAQAEGAEIQRRAPVVDMVLGPQTYHKLPEMIAKVHRKSGDVLETEFDTIEKFDQLPKTRNVKGFSAFLTVQEAVINSAPFVLCPIRAAQKSAAPCNKSSKKPATLPAKGCGKSRSSGRM